MNRRRLNLTALVATLSLGFAALIWLGLASPPARAADDQGTLYYVDHDDGRDTNAGTSPKAAWQSIARVNRAKLKAGDTVLFKRGDTWRARLNVPTSGTAKSPITFGAYASGDLPQIKGSDLLDNDQFTPSKDHKQVYKITVKHRPDAVWEAQTTFLSHRKTLAQVAAHPGSFYWKHKVLYLQPSDSSDPRRNEKTYEAGRRAGAVHLMRSHIRLESLALLHGNSAKRGAVSIYAYKNFDDIKITHCDLSYNHGRGVWISGEGDASLSGLVIADNRVGHNAGSGISVTYAKGGVIRDNQIVGNTHGLSQPWQGGIRLWSDHVRDLVIENNTITNQKWGHPGDGSIGIHDDETGPGVVIRHNTIRHVANAAIEVENTARDVIEYNLAEDAAVGVFVFRAGHKHKIRHNTLVNMHSQGIVLQGLTMHGHAAQKEIQVAGRNITQNRVVANIAVGSKWGNLKAVGGGEQVAGKLGNTYRRNCLGKPRHNFIEWGKTTFDNYAQWEKACHCDTQSIQADPGFVDRANHDYHLRPDAPALTKAGPIGALKTTKRTPQAR